MPGSDKAFVSASEHAAGFGGATSGPRVSVRRAYSRLPWNCCSLTFAVAQTPVIAGGFVFDLVALVPWVRRHGTHPVTGAPLATRDLLRLHFHKTADGADFCCPVTNKVLTEHSRIVCLATSGNVFSWEAVETLNIQQRAWRDLLTDEAFTRADIVWLQDPTSDEWLRAHDVTSFHHVKQGHKAVGAQAGAASMGEGAGAGPGTGAAASASAPNPSGGLIRLNDSSRRVLADLEKSAGSKRPRAEEDAGSASASSSSEPAAAAPHLTSYGVRTSSKFTGGFTSTGMAASTRNEAAAETGADRAALRLARVSALGRKAFCRLRTSLGDLNFELHCDLVPRTCDNFLLLAARGYYDGSRFHRSIRGFMLQGGDPTGMGRGGESAWAAAAVATAAATASAAASAAAAAGAAGGRGDAAASASASAAAVAAVSTAAAAATAGGARAGCFRDEFHHKLLHSARGVLSMANAGPHSNGSQFFVTYAAAPHLDRKHSVFGRLVGGEAVLRAIEAVPTDAEDRPRTPVELLGVDIFQNPFDEVEAQLPAILVAEARARAAAGGASGSALVGGGASVLGRGGPGAFAPGSTYSAAPAAPAATGVAPERVAGTAGGESVAAGAAPSLTQLLRGVSSAVGGGEGGGGAGGTATEAAAVPEVGRYLKAAGYNGASSGGRPSYAVTTAAVALQPAAAKGTSPGAFSFATW